MKASSEWVCIIENVDQTGEVIVKILIPGESEKIWIVLSSVIYIYAMSMWVGANVLIKDLSWFSEYGDIHNLFGVTEEHKVFIFNEFVFFIATSMGQYKHKPKVT